MALRIDREINPPDLIFVDVLVLVQFVRIGRRCGVKYR
jgi:hypothetical protein